MKHALLFLVFFLTVSVFSVNAADMIILKDGSMIEAKVMEIHPGEIRYKRADNLNGPTMFLPADRALSIRYENGVVEVISASPVTGQASGQTAGAGSSGGQQPGAQTLLTSTLQNTLNGLPAIKIAGNNLQFQFGGENWTATLNGEKFWAGTIEVEDTNGGSILNLKQTHMWPGAAGKTAGKLTSKVGAKVPGGAVAGNALNAAGSLAGAVEVSGPVIVLEYKAGPPANLSYLRSTTVAAQSPENPESISGKRYEVVARSMTWTKAKAEAEKRGGYLAVINDAQEQETIANMISTGKKRGYWLGGFYESRVWKWVNNEPMNYTNWAPGEGGSGDYLNRIVMMRTPQNKTKIGQWENEPDGFKDFGYIIEWDE